MSNRKPHIAPLYKVGLGITTEEPEEPLARNCFTETYHS